MFIIHHLSADRYSYSIMCSDQIKPQVIDRPSSGMHESIVNTRIDYICYLLAETMCVSAQTDHLLVKQSAEKWIEWASKRIGCQVPGANFHLILEQWVKCAGFLKACKLGADFYEKNYALAISFLVNWQDESQPILINHTATQAA